MSPAKVFLPVLKYVRTYSALGVFLLITLLSACGGGGSGTPGNPGGSGGGGVSFSMSVTPNPLTLYPNSTSVITVHAVVANSSATPEVTLAQLPTGVTSTTQFPLQVPKEGAQILLQTSASLTTGSYSFTLNGTVGSATKSLPVAFTVNATAPTFFFSRSLFSELAVPIGASGKMTFMSLANGPAAYSVQLSVQGLPAGTTATFNPPSIIPGQSVDVTITASSTAPISQNNEVTLIGTPSADVSPASEDFLVEVAPQPGSLPNNRTDYISTEDTPYAAVYDRVHRLIFASNPSWNRVEVISTTTHAITRQITLPEPTGIDISQDGSKVWVATGSKQIFAIDTTSFAITRYVLPAVSNPNNLTPRYWEDEQLMALADGRLLLVVTQGKFSGTEGILFWNPATNTLTDPQLTTSVSTDAITRSGDGKHVFFIGSTSDGPVFRYDVISNQFTPITHLAGYAINSAVNIDGSRVVICDADGSNLYDGNFQWISPLPGCGSVGPPFFEGGSVFSADNRYLYQVILANVPVIAKIDLSNMTLVRLSPAMPMIPVMTELSPPYYVADPFAVDDSEMVFGLQDWGIAFDDANFSQNYSAEQPGSPTFLQHMSPYFGPLSGGTTSGGFGNAFSLVPDIWYGQNRGTAHIDSANDLTITSPASATAGPVNLKFLFPNGVEVFDPLFFSFGPSIKHAIETGAGPEGGASASVHGFGLPNDGVTGSLKVGGSNAQLAAAGSNGLQFSGTPYPEKVLGYTVPAGVPGWADVTVNTTQGTSTLPKAFFYAQSVTDYSSADTFTAVLYDAPRNQLYLSAGDHIDVFSLATNQFVSPIVPVAQSSTKKFAGLTLTPDGNFLLAADLGDGSLAVVNLTDHSSYAIPIMTPLSGQCAIGPLKVAATINQKAYLTSGGLPGVACGPFGAIYQVDLATRTVGSLASSGACALTFSGFPGFLAASGDGKKLVIGSYDGSGYCIYDASTSTYQSSDFLQPYGAAISSDGNVGAAAFVFTDANANVINRAARPPAYYAGFGSSSSFINLQYPKLNDAGSLYYIPYPNFVDIFDVRHGTLRMRFSLPQTISNTGVPLAIDSGGRHIYLITDKGLTVVDLGEALLSVGSVKPAAAAPGATITVRGSGFDSTVTATVGGHAAMVNFVDENTITLVVPSASSGPASLTLTTGNGNTYTESTMLQIQ